MHIHWHEHLLRISVYLNISNLRKLHEHLYYIPPVYYISSSYFELLSANNPSGTEQYFCGIQIKILINTIFPHGQGFAESTKFYHNIIIGMDIINTTPKISIHLELKLTAVLSICKYPQTKKWNFCIMLQRISDSANASPVLGEGRLKNELFLLYYSQCPTESGFNLKFFTTSKIGQVAK